MPACSCLVPPAAELLMTVLRFVVLLGTAVCGAAHWVIDHDHRELASRSCGERCNPYWDTCSSSSCSNCEQKAGGSSDDYVCMSDSDAASANISNTIIGLIVLGVICALCGTYCCCCKNKTTITTNQPWQQPIQHAAMAVTVPPNCMPGAVLGSLRLQGRCSRAWCRQVQLPARRCTFRTLPLQQLHLLHPLSSPPPVRR